MSIPMGTTWLLMMTMITLRSLTRSITSDTNPGILRVRMMMNVAMSLDMSTLLLMRKDEDEEDARNENGHVDERDYGTRLCMLDLSKLFWWPARL
eukprot:265262-Pyramimonas_sp.AAC.1